MTAPPKIRLPAVLKGGCSYCRGQKIKLRIPITGRPFPKVHWVKEGEVIEPGGRYEVTSGENHAMLVIHDAEKTDMGEYALNAENDSGKDSETFIITIVDRPDPPPTKPKVTDVSRNSVRLCWQTPAYDGGASISTYLIEKCELPGTTWIGCGCTHLTQMSVHRLQDCKV